MRRGARGAAASSAKPTRRPVLALIAAHFEPVRVNGEVQEDTLRFQGYTLSSSMLARALGAQGYPTVAFLDPAGRKITHLPGFTEAPEFARVLRYVGTDAYRSQSFEQFAAADSAATASRQR